MAQGLQEGRCDGGPQSKGERRSGKRQRLCHSGPHSLWKNLQLITASWAEQEHDLIYHLKGPTGCFPLLWFYQDQCERSYFVTSEFPLHANSYKLNVYGTQNDR